MADLVYNQAKMAETINNLENNLKKLREELDTFNTNYEVVRTNWSGDDFDKADEKLKKIKETLETAIADNERQKEYLAGQNDEFARANLWI